MSLVEAVANVVVGFLLALLTQISIFPVFGLVVSVADNLIIGGIFTVVSILRSFALRRCLKQFGVSASERPERLVVQGRSAIERPRCDQAAVKALYTPDSNRP